LIALNVPLTEFINDSAKLVSLYELYHSYV